MIDDAEKYKPILVQLIIEHWKLLRVLEKNVERLPPAYLNKAMSQLKYSLKSFESLLSNASVNVVAFEGRKFEASLPASAINAEEFANEPNLIVEMTIEPAVVSESRVLAVGKVIVGKGNVGAT